MVPKPASELSDELLALFVRADLASDEARRLLGENDRWRQSVLQQLDYMFELGADFRTARRTTSSRALPAGTATPGRIPVPRSGPDGVPIR